MELARVIFAPSLRDDLQAPSSGPTLFLGALGLQVKKWLLAKITSRVLPVKHGLKMKPSL